jgi:hypothetical protein
VATKALISVISPASIDSAKAAVGFGDVFTAKVHPDRLPPHVDYQQTVTLDRICIASRCTIGTKVLQSVQ